MNALLLVFESSPATWIAACTVLGLMIGSFLNVVIHRLPVMLENQWRSQARELLELETSEETHIFNLVTPPSRCPNCDARIRPWQNIPVISYLLLRGRCRDCSQRISIRYPLIEALTGILTGLAAWHFGFSFAALGAFLFLWMLVAMTFIDLDHQLLPDNLTLPLLWLGLLFSMSGYFASPANAIVGAVIGYLSLWTIFHAFRLLTGKEGMGYGDFKLFAAFGAWLGWVYLPLIILLSAGAGALIGIGMILLAGREKAKPIPFGPFLAVAGVVALFFGQDILQWYLGFLPAR